VSTLTCGTCGRVIETGTLDALPAREQRCPRCGAHLAGAVARAVAAASLPPRVAFLGFGLIGGSIALALRSAGAASHLAAWTPEGRGPAEGRQRAIIDTAAPSAAAALEGAELVVLAGPPLRILDTLEGLGGPLGANLADGATVTDVGSTKAAIVEAANRAGLSFVGGHPMAGRETTGVESADGELFVHRPWVIVPSNGAKPVDIGRVEALATAVGARPIRIAAEQHDAAVAAISHLPLVLAAALVESVALSPGANSTWATARGLAAAGWSDMTRLAKGDPEMGAGILATNAAPVAERLRALRQAIDTWIDNLDASGPTGAQTGAPTAAPTAADALGERLVRARNALIEKPPG
jgi:prephenate dehydrogenase